MAPWEALINPVVIRSSRRALVGLGLTFIGIAVAFLVLVGPISGPGQVAGAGAIVGVLLVIAGACFYATRKPATLTVTDQGFTYEYPFQKPRAVAWAEVKELHMWSANENLMEAGIAWNYKQDSRPATTLGRLNRAVGADGLIRGSWKMPASELMALMNARLEASRR